MITFKNRDDFYLSKIGVIAYYTGMLNLKKTHPRPRMLHPFGITITILGLVLSIVYNLFREIKVIFTETVLW